MGEKKCSSCGRTVIETANFCPHCGNSTFFTINNQQGYEVNINSNEKDSNGCFKSNFESSTDSIDPQIEVPTQITAEACVKKKKLKPGKIALIIAISLIVLITVINLFNTDSSKKSDNTPLNTGIISPTEKSSLVGYWHFDISNADNLKNDIFAITNGILSSSVDMFNQDDINLLGEDFYTEAIAMLFKNYGYHFNENGNGGVYFHPNGFKNSLVKLFELEFDKLSEIDIEIVAAKSNMSVKDLEQILNGDTWEEYCKKQRDKSEEVAEGLFSIINKNQPFCELNDYGVSQLENQFQYELEGKDVILHFKNNETIKMNFSGSDTLVTKETGARSIKLIREKFGK